MAYETTPQVRARLRAERKKRRWDTLRMAQQLRNVAEHPHKMPSAANIQRNVDRWETGEVTQIRERNRMLYAAAFDLDERDLFGDTAAPPPEPMPGDVPPEVMTEQERPPWAVRLQYERERRGWSKDEMSRRLCRAIAEHTPLDSLTRQVRDWERGKHFPQHWGSAYATAFDMDQAELFGAPQRPATRSSVGDIELLTHAKDNEVKRRAALEVKRRTVIELLAALATGAAIPAVAFEEVFAGVEHALGDRVDLDRWERTVQEYAYFITRQPVGSLINDLAADVVAVGRLLTVHEHPPLLQAGLMRVSAGLSGLLAREFGDVGNRRAARLSWGAAVRAADASGDRDLSVWVRAMEADDARWAGSPHHIIGVLVDEAIEIANGAPSLGLIRAHTVRTHIAADRSDPATARGALRDLTATFEHLVEMDFTSSPDPLSFGMSEAYLHWHKAYVHTMTGDSRAATTALDHAQTLYPPDVPGVVANLEMIRAIGLVKDREIDAGLQHAVTTIRSRHLSAARRHMTGQILNALPANARTLPAARDLHALTSGKTGTALP